MLLLYVTEEVLLRCSQTGRKIKARVGDLSREDMRPLSEEDLVKGSRLIAMLRTPHIQWILSNLQVCLLAIFYMHEITAPTSINCHVLC